MYPFLRMAKELVIHRHASDLAITGTHTSHHMIWPQDLDFWMELNNGRTLTIYDLGRIPLARRTGLIAALRKNGWGMTVAGSSVRYRRRVTVFQKVEMRSRGIGWDDRFLYVEQSMWRADGECCSHALYRMAITNAKGIVPPAQVAEAIGHSGGSPRLPDWVRAWSDAEAQRPWPPQSDEADQPALKRA